MDDMVLSDKQTEAVRLSTDARNRIVAITGAAGTGKTTIIRMVYDALTHEGDKVVLCAPTGKAANNGGPGIK